MWSLFNSPWMGSSNKTWEWYYSEYGLSLRDLKNPINFYGTVFISTKRDNIISVEQAHWQEYPALKISWRYGSGKIKSNLLVYEPEQSDLVLDRLMPKLAAWPQNRKANV